MVALLDVQNLSVEYKNLSGTVYAVNGLTFSLQPGEVLGLVGETGAGKTTSALSILKLLPEGVGEITSGSITLDGIDVASASEADMRALRGGIASMIFQDPMSSLNPSHTVGDQILEILSIHNEEGKSKEELNKRVDEILELVGIRKERKDDYPHQFSGGMKQRIVIAIALACEPKLILADEPTTALDVTIQAQVLALMLELKQKLNTAMVFITHDLGIVAQMCQRVAVMYAGILVEYGDVEKIYDQDILHPYTKGLFGAIPKIYENTDRLVPIDGMMTDPTQKLPGCPFAERCPRKCPRCEVELPVMYKIEPGHMIRCFLFENDRGKGQS